MSETIADLVAAVRERFPERVSDVIEDRGEYSVDVDRDALAEVAREFRHDLPLLADWSCVDYLDVEQAERRFLCAAVLGRVEDGMRLRLRVWIPDGDERCPSLTSLWPGADYLEREMFDFFGVSFEGHPNMRRIFMPDDWEGHPQRKDYPLGGTNVTYHGGNFIPPPDVRRQGTATTGYPGRTS